MGHIATAVIKVVAFKRTVVGIVIECGKWGKRQFLHGPYLIDPEEGLQIVSHVLCLALQVAALLSHQEQHATGRIVHGLDVSRIMQMAQILQINHTFIV